jgi:hypothetical protein
VANPVADATSPVNNHVQKIVNNQAVKRYVSILVTVLFFVSIIFFFLLSTPTSYYNIKLLASQIYFLYGLCKSRIGTGNAPTGEFIVIFTTDASKFVVVQPVKTKKVRIIAIFIVQRIAIVFPRIELRQKDPIFPLMPKQTVKWSLESVV